MKTQFRKGIWMVGLLCLCVVVAFAQKKTEKKETLSGVWAYSLPDAPYEYQAGTVEFKSVDQKLTGKCKTRNSTLEIKDILHDGEKYTSTFDVDGYTVNISLKPENGKITGSVVADSWKMPITMEKRKK